MTSEIVQLSALITYGNAKVRGLEVDVERVDDAFNREWSDVRFIFSSGTSCFARDREIATRGSEWFDWLYRRGCTGLRAISVPTRKSEELPKHIAIAFTGGGPQWILSTRFTNDVIWWRQSTQMTNGPPNTRWSYGYYGAVVGRDMVEVSAIEPIADRLRATVTKAREFALRHEALASWNVWFSRALEALDAEAPESVGVHMPAYDLPIVAIEALRLPARRLLTASKRAWVFGGMGSWNDAGFRDIVVNAAYHELSATLYDAVVDGMIAAINSSDEIPGSTRV